MTTRNTPDLVLVLDPIHEDGIARLARSFRLKLPGEALSAEDLSQATAAVVRAFEVNGPWLAQTPRLRIVTKHGSGVDNIDVPAATAHGVMVANTPGGANSTAVAEGAVALMLAVLRRVREMDALVRENRFGERWTLRLGDLTGGRLGLVGFGQISRVTARIGGAGFGMSVSAFDPFVSAEEMAKAGVAKVEDLTDLMAGSDVISVHVPLSARTRHLIGERELAAMPANAIIVNTSRGGLIHEPSLAAALREGRIAGAGIDVFDVEPPPADDPLFALPNVVLSPHVAGVTNGSMRDMALNVAKVVEQALSGGRPATLLNPDVLASAAT
ncbi:hydroxyacid dehydrogenase [Aquabacter cavernae]|uniref:hydroxyacid dehydrogenase n=1 Tax=Aquabacter cavernae TaxID=2496029 RepID=UPI000F8D3AEE|nr:hydroxyacid dehydrogenase [Aquabacter cavernae]